MKSNLLFCTFCALASDLVSYTASLSPQISTGCGRHRPLSIIALSKSRKNFFGGRPLKSTSASAPFLSDRQSSDEIEHEENRKIKANYIEQEKGVIKKKIAVGGPLSFNTKYGRLNPFGIYWLLLSSSLGLVWFALLQLCRLFYWVTGNRFDKNKRIPTFFSHVWGTLLLRLSNSYPPVENRELLDDLFTKQTAAMFVANHASWNDIPYLGVAIGWRNYKFVGKKELLKVPILSSAIQVSGHIALDRRDRVSGVQAVKKGINWLKNGVHLCTFPEGTRSRDGRLLRFKNGAFKMAWKAGVPVVPISIVNAHKVMPPEWMMPFRSSRGIAKVIIHKPVDSAGKTEDELAAEVRQAIITGLPEEQRPSV